MTLKEWCNINNRVDILDEWHPIKNGTLRPDNVTSGSGKKAWWRLPYDDPKTGKHFDFEWISSIADRTGAKQAGCPYLSGKKILPGFNDLKTFSEINHLNSIIEDFDSEKNDIYITAISPGSNKKIWWKCHKCGFQWQAAPHNRTGNMKAGCPNCGRNKQRVDITDIVGQKYGRLLVLEPIMNNSNSSHESRQQYRCQCDCGRQVIKARDLLKSRKAFSCGCLQTESRNNHHKVSFETWCKQNDKLELLQDWDYSSNGLPSDYGYGSSRVVSWVCSKCGYKWSTRLNARTRNNRPTGCKKCAKRNNTSFPEQAVYYYIHKYFPDAINGDRKILKELELDIYIPSINVAIEYDGKKWHSLLKRDIHKDNLCKDKGILLYRIRESAEHIDDYKESIVMTYKPFDWNQLNFIIKTLLEDFGVIVGRNEIDIERDSFKIKEQYFNDLKSKSLLSMFPLIASEWDYDKNGTLKPSMISPEDHDAYWWICPNCHESYKAIVKNRTRLGSACNKCGAIEGGRKQSSGIRIIDTGQTFESVAEAALYIGVSKAAIVKCCQGQNKTCRGLRLEYIDRDTNSRPITLKQPTQRPVRNKDTGQLYESLAAAVSDTGITNISAVCRGLRKTAGGYRWEYADK